MLAKHAIVVRKDCIPAAERAASSRNELRIFESIGSGGCEL